MKILKIELDEQEKLDVITNVIESRGIQYWACEYGPINIWRDEKLNILKAEFDADDRQGERQHYVVTPEVVQLGVERILTGSFEVSDYIRNQICADDHDADTDDCIVQAGLFGKLVYG